MALTYKVLGQVVPAAATPTTLYTVPALTQAVCSTLSICSQGVSGTVRVAVRPAGAALDPKHYIVYDIALNQYESLMLTLGITLGAGDVVTVQASTPTVSFGLFGSEVA